MDKFPHVVKPSGSVDPWCLGVVGWGVADHQDRQLDLTGLEIPEVFPPAGNYRSAAVHGGVLYTAGHIPLGADGTLVLGRLGDTLTVEEGAHAARLAALSVLATVRAELGSLDRVERVLRVLVVVHATPDFGDHTRVGDGASDVFTQVWGEHGAHPRLAVGVSSLPVGMAVEVEATLAVR